MAELPHRPRAKSTSSYVGLLVVALLSACSSARYIRSGPKLPPRPAGCSFEIHHLPVTQPYQLLGTADIEAAGPRYLPTRSDELRALLKAQICAAGANGLIAVKNGRGRYVLAKVVRFHGDKQVEVADRRQGP